MKPYGFSTQDARARRQEIATNYYYMDEISVAVTYRHQQTKQWHTELVGLHPDDRAHWPYIALYKLRNAGIPAARVRIEE